MLNKHNEDIIKKSFESFSFKAPVGIWENIDRRLYTDRVWFRLSKDLDRIQNRKRLYRSLKYSAFVLLVVIFSFCSFYYYNKLREAALLTKRNSEQFKSGKEFSKYYSDYGEVKANLDIREENKLKPAPIIIQESAKTKVKSSESFLLIKKLNEDSSKENLSMNFEKSKIKENNIFNKMTSLSPELFFDSIDVSMSKIFSDSIYNFDIIDKTIYGRYRHQFGVIFALNSTMMINNDFIEGFREGSTVKILPSLASGCGITYNYYYSETSSVSSDFYFISNHNQYINVYANGRYYKKSTELQYYKIAFLYQKNISLSKIKTNSTLYFKAGFYYSVLSKNNVYYTRNGVNIELPSSGISKSDFGTKICFGKETTFNRIVLGGGLQSEYGIKNLFTGDEYEPSDFNRTNNFSYGLFLTVKLKR